MAAWLNTFGFLLRSHCDNSTDAQISSSLENVANSYFTAGHPSCYSLSTASCSRYYCWHISVIEQLKVGNLNRIDC
jgi:hypothetical protein